MIENILDQLKRDEGRRTRPYLDSRGNWTVGYGHNLTTGDLTEDAITQILRDDIHTVDTYCLSLPFWFQLSEPRRGVLLNMAFNLGFGGLLKFQDLLRACTDQDWTKASDAMLNSTWALQVGDRAHRLARQMRDDQWA